MTDREAKRILPYLIDRCHSEAEKAAIRKAENALQERIDREKGCNKPMTNADRIRAMSDEELTVFLDEFSGRCAECENDKGNTSCPIYCGGVFCLPSEIMNWLRQPAKED